MAKNKGGRPPHYKTPKELQAKIDEYFEKPPNTRTMTLANGSSVEIPLYGVSGLAYALGFMDRQSLYDYDNRSDKFSCIVKRARLFIESEYEVALRDNNVTGIIFALKQMGWKDRQEIDHAISDYLHPELKDIPDSKLKEILKVLNKKDE